MIITEADLRRQLRPPTIGARVRVPAGARMSPAALDFVKQWDLSVVDGDPTLDAMPEKSRVNISVSHNPVNESMPARPVAEAVHTPVEKVQHHHIDEAMAWDKDSVFPVNFAGEIPTCEVCGMAVTKKSSQLTQLNAKHFAPKTNPRIVLRGRVDSLHALVMLIQRMAKQDGDLTLCADLRTIAAYCRELTSAEYNERPVAELTLKDWDAERIHKATHDPKGVLGIDHLTIDENEPELQHWLNMARTMSREIEITAMEAFPEPDHPYGASICHAFNRLSSVFYFLQLRMKAGK